MVFCIIDDEEIASGLWQGAVQGARFGMRLPRRRNENLEPFRTWRFKRGFDRCVIVRFQYEHALQSIDWIIDTVEAVDQLTNDFGFVIQSSQNCVARPSERMGRSNEWLGAYDDQYQSP